MLNKAAKKIYLNAFPFFKSKKKLDLLIFNIMFKIFRNFLLIIVLSLLNNLKSF